MSTVLTNTTEPASHERVKEYYCLLAENQLLADHEQAVTISTLLEWKSNGDVGGPLSRDDFLRLVRGQQIVETTIIWEVWDGTTVWPYLQAQKLTLFREVNRVTLPSAKSPPVPSVSTPTDDVSADELLGSVLQESCVELPLTKPSLLWRIPLISWFLVLCGWRPRGLPTTVRPADPIGESPTEQAFATQASSGRNATPTTLATDKQTVANDADGEPNSTTTDTADSNLNGIGGLSLDDLEDADAATPQDQFGSATAVFRPAAEVGQIAETGNINGPLDEPPPDGRLHGAIANAVDYFDAKTANSLAQQDQLQAAKPRLRDQLMMVVLQAGRFVVWPFRGIIALSEKAVASERTLVTGESFQRLEASLRRGLTHPLTWGVVAGGVFLAVLSLVMAMRPDRPDELDMYAVRKLKEAQEAIQAVRATRPDEKAWAEFSQTLTGELTVLKEALQKDMKTNRPIKEGLYLELEYRLPRILKEGRLKPSPVEGGLATRLRDAERRIKSASH